MADILLFGATGYTRPTAELLTAAAVTISSPSYTSWVMSPVQAVGLNELMREMIDHLVSMRIFTG